MPGDSMLRDGRFRVSERDISTLRSLDVHGAAHVRARMCKRAGTIPSPRLLSEIFFSFRSCDRVTQFWNFSKKQSDLPCSPGRGSRWGVYAKYLRISRDSRYIFSAAYRYLGDIDSALVFLSYSSRIFQELRDMLERTKKGEMAEWRGAFQRLRLFVVTWRTFRTK